MTASTHHGTLNTAAYSPQQAFARDVLTAAVNGGIRHWACMHGYQWDVPPGQVHAEGVDDRDGRSLWRVDLDDIQRALDTLTDDPDLCWPAIENRRPDLARRTVHHVACHPRRTSRLRLPAAPRLRPPHRRPPRRHCRPDRRRR